MEFIPLGNSDARLIELVVHNDDRGNFARTWCVNSVLEQGIDFRPVIHGNSRHGAGDAFSTRAKSRFKAGSLHNKTHSRRHCRFAIPKRVAALSANDAGWPLLADRNFWPGKRGS
jgi:hypothetical protein